MSFTRTAAGLTNLHIFYGVDAIVFLEGGPSSFNLEQVETGKFHCYSSDIRYWQNIFAVFRPSKTFQFRSVGSKRTVRKIAKKLQKNNVRHVIAVMDRDFDHINSRLMLFDNVIYTHGYSWENDVWSFDSIYESFYSITGTCKTTVDISHEIKQCLSNFSFSLKGGVRLDAVLSQYSISFFDRKINPIQYINISAISPPEIKLDKVKESLLDAKANVSRPIKRLRSIAINLLSDCYGHLFAEFCYRIIIFLLKSHCALPKIAKEYVTSSAVEKYIELLKGGMLPVKKAHYENEFLRVHI